MEIRKSLEEALEAGSYIDLASSDGSHSGFVLGVSDNLVLLQSIYEWQDYGALVVPGELIESVGISEDHAGQLDVLAFNSVKRTKRYAAIKFGNLEELFRSLKPRGKFVVLSFGEEAEVGLIEAVGKESVDIKTVTPGGSWSGDTVECGYDDITLVQFDDNYSRVLQRYMDRAPALN